MTNNQLFSVVSLVFRYSKEQSVVVEERRAASIEDEHREHCIAFDCRNRRLLKEKMSIVWQFPALDELPRRIYFSKSNFQSKFTWAKWITGDDWDWVGQLIIVGSSSCWFSTLSSWTCFRATLQPYRWINWWFSSVKSDFIIKKKRRKLLIYLVDSFLNYLK